MNLFCLYIFFPILFSFVKSGKTAIPEIDGILKRVSEDRNDGKFYIVILDEKNKTEYICDDFFIITAIEQHYGIFFEDFAGRDISHLDMRLILKNIGLITITHNKRKMSKIDSGDSTCIRLNSDDEIKYSDINPGRPEPDFYHRYIDVPVDYKDKDSKTFKLYYELSTDYDPSKPIVIVPADGQRFYSQAGWADRYKNIFNLDSFNVVTFEYRGMYLSRIEELKKGDWQEAYRILNTDNAVEDIEMIRRDLAGEGRVNILGGSGIAMMGLKYISKYRNYVDRAFLMSFFRDAKGSSEAGNRYFKRFLEKNGLNADFKRVLSDPSADIPQLLYMVQRLLYNDSDEAALLIRDTAEKRMKRFEKNRKKFGSVDFFVRFYQKYCPWSVVFMYETNIPEEPETGYDINYPYLKFGEPLIELEKKGSVRFKPFCIDSLEKVRTEILLIGGTLDQVAPLEETERIYRDLPNSRFAVFEAYHCLQVLPETRKCRNDIASLFFQYGLYSEELENYLKINGSVGGFIKFYEKDTFSGKIK